jgi:DNA polymerase-3 subunit beta
MFPISPALREEVMMRIHFNPKDFAPKFCIAASVANSKDTNPILQNVKIIVDKQEGVILQATDSQVGIRIRAGCEVTQHGMAILPKDRLLKILNVTKESMLTLEYVEEKIVINGTDERYELDTMQVEEFPDIEEFAAPAYHEIFVKVLQAIIRRTVYATDPENVKYALGGVYFAMTGQDISTVGTDGRRLAWQEFTGVSINNHTVESAIVSAPALQLLSRALGDKSITEHDSVKMAVSEGMVGFQCKELSFFSRLTEGKFPKWRNIIPNEEGKILVRIDSEPLMSAIIQAQVTTSEFDPGVDFLFEKGKLTLQGQGKERGSTKIALPIAYTHDPINVKIDPKFMIDFLRVLESNQKVSLYLPPDGDTPIKITADNGVYGYVVMPMSK